MAECGRFSGRNCRWLSARGAVFPATALRAVPRSGFSARGAAGRAARRAGRHAKRVPPNLPQHFAVFRSRPVRDLALPCDPQRVSAIPTTAMPTQVRLPCDRAARRFAGSRAASPIPRSVGAGSGSDRPGVAGDLLVARGRRTVVRRHRRGLTGASWDSRFSIESGPRSTKGETP